MTPNLALIGLSHHSAPIEERERLALAEADVAQEVQQLLSVRGIDEAVVLTTCNRVEYYVAGGAADVSRVVRDHIAAKYSLSDQWFQRFTYRHDDVDGIAHLFRVAGSLDSLVVGEPQILGQVKAAYDASSSVGGTGPFLNKLFHHAFRTAKRIRTETRIAENAVSISFAAVELAKKVFGDLNRKSVLIVGAGKMGALAARHLISAGAATVHIANRTYDRALELVETLGGTAHSLDELDRLLETVDIVVSSTGSQHFVIRYDAVKAALVRRKFRPLFLIDIAVPRDIDPRCDSLDNTYLFDIDDLEKVVEANRQARASEAAMAQQIVVQEVEAAQAWIRQAHVVPTIVHLRNKLTSLKDLEIERMRKENPNLSAESVEAADRMARALINKVLHEPTISLRRASSEGHHVNLVSAVRSLFALNEESDAASFEEKS